MRYQQVDNLVYAVWVSIMNMVQQDDEQFREVSSVQSNGSQAETPMEIIVEPWKKLVIHELLEYRFEDLAEAGSNAICSTGRNSHSDDRAGPKVSHFSLAHFQMKAR